MFNVETQTIVPGRTSVSIQVIKPTLVVAEYLERRELGIRMDNNPDRPEQIRIHLDPTGQKLLTSITSTPEFLAMVHASNGGLRWMDLRPCGWDEDTKIRLLATSAMIDHHHLLHMSCTYNDLKNACPPGPNSNFQPFLERSIELEVMAEERRNQAKALLDGRQMLAMQEAKILLQRLSDQIIDHQKQH
ncbi:hypothetical protein HYU96_02535 [Candidatus Daviesbacteria bacterium]|nr:hypothetical protein [Candidatus Daviesbacteria bacterium]